MDTERIHRQIIMTHYNTPQNKINEKIAGYDQQKGINPSCGDELTLHFKYENNILKDLKFEGEGCSICCASASIITQELNNNTKDEILNKIKNFSNLLQGKEFEESIVEDAIAFSGLAKFPARYKCAFLAWQTVEDYLKKN